MRIIGNLVTDKTEHTSNYQILHFAYLLATVNFTNSLKNHPYSDQGVIELKVVQEFDFPSIEVEKIASLPNKPNPSFAYKQLFSEKKQ
ncbi:MAG: hypothetical protein JEZ09_06720 [Salinivirgaceae bacterium]|nr:hypothetical protein [Salinivirgaceae bacterium]